MARKDLLTLSPRLARRELGRHIILYLEHSPDTKSGLCPVKAVCDICPLRCTVSLMIRGRLSSVSVDGFAGALFLLCKSLDDADTAFVTLDGPSAAISAAAEEE